MQKIHYALRDHGGPTRGFPYSATAPKTVPPTYHTPVHKKLLFVFAVLILNITVIW